MADRNGLKLVGFYLRHRDAGGDADGRHGGEGYADGAYSLDSAQVASR